MEAVEAEFCEPLVTKAQGRGEVRPWGHGDLLSSVPWPGASPTQPPGSAAPCSPSAVWAQSSLHVPPHGHLWGAQGFRGKAAGAQEPGKRTSCLLGRLEGARVRGIRSRTPAPGLDGWGWPWKPAHCAPDTGGASRLSTGATTAPPRGAGAVTQQRPSGQPQQIAVEAGQRPAGPGWEAGPGRTARLLTNVWPSPGTGEWTSLLSPLRFLSPCPGSICPPLVPFSSRLLPQLRQRRQAWGLERAPLCHLPSRCPGVWAPSKPMGAPVLRQRSCQLEPSPGPAAGVRGVASTRL